MQMMSTLNYNKDFIYFEGSIKGSHHKKAPHDGAFLSVKPNEA
jgi:hypothetical protein